MPNEIKSASGQCPICGRSTQYEYRPFCSKVCADVDLGRWLKGIYATPSVDQSSDASDENPHQDNNA